MQLERHEGIWKLSQELLEKCGDLHRVLFCEVNVNHLLRVDLFFDVVKSLDVPVLAEDTLNRHVHCPHCGYGILDKDRYTQGPWPDAIC